MLGTAAWSSARAEGAQDTLVAMGRYLQAVARLFADTGYRVDGIEVGALDADVRTALRHEIAQLAQALDGLLGPKAVFVQDLRGYARRARAGGFDSPQQRRNAWGAIQREVEGIARGADDVLEIVSRADSRLDVVIPDEDRLRLGQVMRQRRLLLRRFPEIPPPEAAGELLALDEMVEQHEQLRLATERFRLTLEGKRRTLAA
ncbi:hypothetical protein [Aquabacterium humicola]|uniref:hypothetical protein n=1 Tax=Aquabacterium humicola TaxID=3237377 RepID=UPI002542830D|nr:hypothetical protein [Rubrivivax pictus]